MLQADRMAEGEDRSVEVDGGASLFRVDISLARGIAQFGTQLRGTEGHEVDVAGRCVVLCLGAQGGLHAIVGLVFEGELLTVVEHHPFDVGPLEGDEDIVLVGVKKFVGGCHDIVGRREGQRALRELSRQVVLLVQRPDDVAPVVVLVGLPAVGDIAPEEEIGVEVSRRLR